MLLYEYGVRDKIESLAEYAKHTRAKFTAGATADALLLDAKALAVLYSSLQERLPASVRDVSNLSRHIGWMNRWLEKGSVQPCVNDIELICDFDIPEVELAFRNWCKNADHYDIELRAAVSDLVLRQEHDSAIRKAFVILKSRLCSMFTQPETLDGAALVNQIFGGNGSHSLKIDDSERQSLRDLLAGLFGVYRNHHAHTNTDPSWAESDGIISIINLVLLDLERLKAASTS